MSKREKAKSVIAPVTFGPVFVIWSYIKAQFRIIQIFRNWITFYKDVLHLTNQKHIIYELRNGLRYRSRANTLDQLIILEIWLLQYNPPGFEIKSSDTVLDIGSHIGAFSIFASKHAKNGTVYSFEPNPENYSLLEQNITINKINNLIPSNKAVAKMKGLTEMIICQDNTGGHSFVLNKNNKQSQVITIETTTLIDIVEENRINQIDFLKMDCEGAEYEILFSCPDHIFNMIHKMSIEYHNIDKQRNAQILKEFLEKKGFRVEVFSEGRLPIAILYAKK
ncbi:MAG: FkbM family methyltransferase [Candidatus Hodarchaeales archaeon]